MCLLVHLYMHVYLESRNDCMNKNADLLASIIPLLTKHALEHITGADQDQLVCVELVAPYHKSDVAQGGVVVEFGLVTQHLSLVTITIDALWAGQGQGCRGGGEGYRHLTS